MVYFIKMEFYKLILKSGIIGVIILNCFAQTPLLEEERKERMPPTPAEFVEPQQALEKEEVKLGEVTVKWEKTLTASKEEDNLVFSYSDTDSSVNIKYEEGSIIIEYGGSTIVIDGSVEVGEIIIGEEGVRVYDKNGNLIGGINKDGVSFWKMGGVFVSFSRGMDLVLKGDAAGNINYLEADTFWGKYTIEVKNNAYTFTPPRGEQYTVFLPPITQQENNECKFICPPTGSGCQIICNKSL